MFWKAKKKTLPSIDTRRLSSRSERNESHDDDVRVEDGDAWKAREGVAALRVQPPSGVFFAAEQHPSQVLLVRGDERVDSGQRLGRDEVRVPGRDVDRVEAEAEETLT